MPKISIWNGRAMQFAEIDDVRWRTMKPHPPSSKRLIHRANGPVTRILAGPRLWETFVNNIDSRENALSLGMSALEFIKSDSKNWYKGWYVSKDVVDARHPNNRPTYLSKPHSIQWKTSPIIDPSQIWLGLFFSGGASMVAARVQVFYGIIWQLGKTSKLYFIGGDAGYVCAGLGASGAVSFGILTGFRSAPPPVSHGGMVGFTKADYGIEVDLGANWGKFLGLAVEGVALTNKLRPAFQALVNLKLAYNFAEFNKKVHGQAGRVANAGTLTKLGHALLRDPTTRRKFQNAAAKLDDVEVAKLILTSLGVDGTKKGWELISFGAGLEISAYGGIAQIKFAVPL